MVGKNTLDDNTSRCKVRRSFPVTFAKLGTMDSGLEFKTITPLLHYSITPPSCGMTMNLIYYLAFPCQGNKEPYRASLAPKEFRALRGSFVNLGILNCKRGRRHYGNG